MEIAVKITVNVMLSNNTALACDLWQGAKGLEEDPNSMGGRDQRRPAKAQRSKAETLAQDRAPGACLTKRINE